MSAELVVTHVLFLLCQTDSAALLAMGDVLYDDFSNCVDLACQNIDGKRVELVVRMKRQLVCY